jgi:hypothetical protein
MTTHFKKSEAEFLEQARVALDNAVNQSEIASALADIGYTAEIITAGKTIYTETRAAFNLNKTEDDETSDAYAAFSKLKEQLYDMHFLHRKKAKVIFRNDHISADKLAIKGSLPQSYVKWIEAVRKFYTTALADEGIQTKLALLAITTEKLNSGNDLVPQVETARAGYLRENGESQDATKAKDAAIGKLDDWMLDFYAVAKIALEEKPQLLEALGIIVKG